MKKIFLLLFVSFVVFTACSQTSDAEYYYNGIESYQDLNLSPEQVARIKELKREKGPLFEAIGRDRSLSGYEKGRKKRELALRYREEMQSILTAEQVKIWEGKYGKLTPEYSMKDVISDDFDAKLDSLERKYDADKDAIKNNQYLSKKEKKAQEEALDSAYKTEKEKLKARKKVAKGNF